MTTAKQLYPVSVSLKRILFGMDFSPSSLLAFPFAVSIAKTYGGNILVAHITPAEDYDAVPAAWRAETVEAAMEEALSSPVGQLRDIPHELLYDHGSVPSRMLAVANNREVDLIVIGTHGWGGIKKLLKGSTAEEISLLSTTPVLTVGPNVSRTSNFERILYATDFSFAAEHALPLALSLSETYDASLLFVHINDCSGREQPVNATRNTVKFFDEQMFRFGIGKPIRDKSEIIVDFGPQSDLILEFATSRQADLIVLGSAGSGDIKARIAAHLPGSLPYDVTSQALCPVLTVPSPKRS